MGIQCSRSWSCSVQVREVEEAFHKQVNRTQSQLERSSPKHPEVPGPSEALPHVTPSSTGLGDHLLTSLSLALSIPGLILDVSLSVANSQVSRIFFPFMFTAARRPPGSLRLLLSAGSYLRAPFPFFKFAFN